MFEENAEGKATCALRVQTTPPPPHTHTHTHMHARCVQCNVHQLLPTKLLHLVFPQETDGCFGNLSQRGEEEEEEEEDENCMLVTIKDIDILCIQYCTELRKNFSITSFQIKLHICRFNYSR
jgi:hypothetical protein